MSEFTIWVPGIPQPQGSIQYKGRSRAGKPILTSDNARLKPWRQMITWLVSIAEDWQPIEGGVAVEINFVFTRPAFHSGKKGLLPSAPADHLVKPDLDKLVRAVLDALTEAGAFRDDSQVVRILTTKAYTTTNPGATITVRSAQPRQESRPSIPAQEQAHGSRPAGIRRVVG